MRSKWGIGRWRENEAHLLCVTIVALDSDSITGKTYSTKPLAIFAAKQWQARHGFYDGIVALNCRTNRVEWVRRFRIEYDVEGDYGQGFELLTCEDTYPEARNQLKTYQESAPGISYRIRARKVKINPDNHGGETMSNEARMDPDLNKRTDRQELAILRQSIARIAQRVNAQSIVLPVVSKPDNKSLDELSRTQDRGWNALCASILNNMDRDAANLRASLRNVINLALEYIAGNTHTMKDVENLLLSISSIVPKRARLHYQYAISEISEGYGETTASHHLRLVLLWIDSEDAGINIDE